MKQNIQNIIEVGANNYVPEVKNRISRKKRESQSKGTIKLHVDHHKETPPEANFREVISKFDIPNDIYQFYMPKLYDENFKKAYEMDFAIPDLKISFEVNGNFHYDTSTWELKEYYKERREYIESFGWTQIDIHYLICFNEEKLTKIINDALNGKFPKRDDVTKEIKNFYEAKLERKKEEYLKKKRLREERRNAIKNTTKQSKPKIKRIQIKDRDHVHQVLKAERLESLKQFLLNNPNYVSAPTDLDEYMDSIFDRKTTLDFIDRLEDTLKLIISNRDKIDFSKMGWGEKLGSLMGVCGNSATRFVRKYIPKFYNEVCFRRKDPDPVKNKKLTYQEMREQFINNRIDSIINSGIDFTQTHWVKTLAQYLGVKDRRHLCLWIEEHMPDFFRKYINYDYNRYPTQNDGRNGISAKLL